VNGRTTQVVTELCDGMAVIDDCGRIPKDRTAVQLASCSSHESYGNHNNNLPNVLRAVKERVFCVSSGGSLVPPPQPIPGAWDQLVWFADAVSKEVGPRRRLTRNEFVAQCPPSKRKLYKQCVDKLNQSGLRRGHATIRAFVKNEKVKFERSGAKSDPAPRLIQPRHPMFNVELGRYTRAVENDIFAAMAKVCKTVDGGKVVAKGLCPLGVGKLVESKWRCFKDPVVISLDASRFDQHVSVDALKFEHLIYKAIFENDPDLLWLLEQQLTTRGVYRGEKTLRYEKEGGRCSGDMNTGLGNCILMVAMASNFLESRKIKYTLLDNGDDLLVFMERRRMSDLQGLSAYFRDLGFTIKMESTHKEKRYGDELVGYTDILERVEFCQSSPVLTCDGYVMVREPSASFAKDTLSLCKPGDFRKWIGAVGMGGTKAFGDIPVCSALYKAFVEQGDHTGDIANNNLYSDSGFSRMCRISLSRGSEILDRTRMSYYLAFGLPPSYQKDVEDRLLRVEIEEPVPKPYWFKPQGYGMLLRF
jgi:hypothetical protein